MTGQRAWGRHWRVLTAVMPVMAGRAEAMTALEIAAAVHYRPLTVRQALNDAVRLGLVERVGRQPRVGKSGQPQMLWRPRPHFDPRRIRRI